MADDSRPGMKQPVAVDLFRVLTLKQVLTLAKILTAAAIVLHLVYFLGASLVHQDGVRAATARLGSTAYSVAIDFVLFGTACILELFRKK